MIINLEYASLPQDNGSILVQPFAYTVDDSADGDGGAPVRDANYAEYLIRKFTSHLDKFELNPPGPEWNPVFRIVLSVEQVRHGSALYCVRDYQRLDCSAVYNEVCRGYMELYAELKAIVRRAKKRNEAESKTSRGAFSRTFSH